MKSINMTEWRNAVIDSSQRLAIPIMTHPGIEMSGFSVKKTATDGCVHAEAIKALDDAFPAAAVVSIMDLTVEAEAFGSKILFKEDSIPTVIGRLVSNWESVEQLSVPDVGNGRVREFLKANRIIAQSIKDKPVFAGCIGPFSLAGRLFDISEMMLEMYICPDTVQILLDKCTQFLKAYVKEIKDTGVNGVLIAEPAAGLVSNDDCLTFSSRYIKEIVDEYQDDHFMIILHNCGNTGHCTDAMIHSGAAAYHFGNNVDMVAALKECPPESLVMGNIDPVRIMRMADPDKVNSKTLELLEKTKDFPNFIISTGCDVPPHVPVENIKAFYEAIRTFNCRDTVKNC